MKITTVRVACAKTINLGNSQTMKIEADVTAFVEDEDTLPDVSAVLQAEVKRILEETWQEQRKKSHA